MATYAKAAVLAVMLVALLTGSMAAPPMKASSKPSGKPSGKAPSGARDGGDCKSKVIYRYLALHKYADGTDLANALDLEKKSLSNCTANFYRAVIGLDLGIGASIFGAAAAPNFQLSKILDFETLPAIEDYKTCQKASIATIGASAKSKVIYNVTACDGDAISSPYITEYIYNITTKPVNAGTLKAVKAQADGLTNEMICVIKEWANGNDNNYGAQVGDPQNFHPFGGNTGFDTVNKLRAFWANAFGPPPNPYIVTLGTYIDNGNRIQISPYKIK